MDKEKLRELVHEGYKQGLVKIMDAPADSYCFGIVCNIADGYFYFGGMTADEFETAEAFLKETDINENLDDITEAIYGIYEHLDECEDGEATMYYNYLKERVKF